MRRLFDSLIPFGSQLRDLAVEICRLGPSAFHTGKLPPFNFLANAELGAAWHPPHYRNPNIAVDIAEWKSNYAARFLSPAEEHGFVVDLPLTLRGLAMLFDPLVDAFIGAHLQNTSSIPSGCTIIVLTDYSSLPSSISSSTSGDWSSQEVTKVLQGNIHSTDKTTKKLFNAIFSPDWSNQKSLISNEICKNKLLVWNFLPMFRGGNKNTGDEGLPKGQAWELVCCQFLWKFAAAVGAARVIFACAQGCGVGTSTGTTNIGSSSNPPTTSPLPSHFSSRPSCVTGVYRINHPYSWGINNHDGGSLRGILSGGGEPIG